MQKVVGSSPIIRFFFFFVFQHSSYFFTWQKRAANVPWYP
jgi:hypothetical protein